MICRALKRSNSRSTYYHHMSSPNSTISSFGRCGSQRRSGIEPVRARAPVGLSGRAWTRPLKPRRSVNWRSGCGSSRIPMELQLHPMLHLCRLVSTTAIIHRTLPQTTARAASQSNYSSLSCDVALFVAQSRMVMLVDIFLHPRLLFFF